jgi:hypothetical protein
VCDELALQSIDRKVERDSSHSVYCQEAEAKNTELGLICVQLRDLPLKKSCSSEQGTAIVRELKKEYSAKLFHYYEILCRLGKTAHLTRSFSPESVCCAGADACHLLSCASRAPMPIPHQHISLSGLGFSQTPCASVIASLELLEHRVPLAPLRAGVSCRVDRDQLFVYVCISDNRPHSHCPCS